MHEKQGFYYKKNRQQLKCFYCTALLVQPTKAAETIGITQSSCFDADKIIRGI